MSLAPVDELAALSLNEPYSCTYLCGESFPTRLEWRQHELRAHHQAEMWRCSVTVGSEQEAECGATFYSKETFTTHLTSVHSVPSEDCAAWIDCGHIHSEGQVNFWCGFCRRIIPLANMGVEAWKERLDHLQKHFDNGDSLAKGWLKLRY